MCTNQFLSIQSAYCPSIHNELYMLMVWSLKFLARLHPYKHCELFCSYYWRLVSPVHNLFAKRKGLKSINQSINQPMNKKLRYYQKLMYCRGMLIHVSYQCYNSMLTSKLHNFTFAWNARILNTWPYSVADSKAPKVLKNAGLLHVRTYSMR